jgi:hypothetical protein
MTKKPHEPQPLPKDITLDRVRTLMEKHQKARTNLQATLGGWLSVRDVILCMNGYDPGLQPPALGKSLAAAKAKLQRSPGSTIDGEPTTQQKNVTRQRLEQLLAQNLVEKQRGYGNGFDYRWVTPEITAARDERTALLKRASDLRACLCNAFGVSTDSTGVDVEVLDNKKLRVKLTCGEVTAERLIKLLNEAPK